jgi:hypothetical protein
MLADLLSGASPSEPAGSLSNVVRAPAGKQLTLVGALNALRRGELARPADTALGAALDDFAVTAPPAHRPAPAADLAREVEAQRAQDRIDQQEMLARVYARRGRADAAAARRLDEAAAELVKGSA